MTACFGNLDDLALAVPMELAQETRGVAVACLGQVGLRLDMSKCSVLTLTKRPPEGWDTGGSRPLGTTVSSPRGGRARKTSRSTSTSEERTKCS